MLMDWVGDDDANLSGGVILASICGEGEGDWDGVRPLDDVLG